MTTPPTAGTAGKMLRVSSTRPCPICSKPDWCLVAAGGDAAICARVESPKRCGDAGWLHRLNGHDYGYTRDAKKPEPATGRAKDWQHEAAAFAKNFTGERRADLAAQFGLPTEVLDTLPLLGFNPSDRRGPCYTFPECSSNSSVTGLNRRFASGEKRMFPGGKRGLTLPVGWRDRPGPLLAVEGASDTLALTAAGLCAVGRPSNNGGVTLLAELLRDWPADRDIIVVGENDQKPDGQWPGRDGAEQSARRLAAKLDRCVKWALPPSDAKDARVWLTCSARSGTPWLLRGKELLAAVEANATTFTPSTAPVPDGEPYDDPANPHRLAAGFKASMPEPIRFWRGDFWKWEQGAYRPVSEGDMRGELTVWIRREFVELNIREVEIWKAEGNPDKPAPATRRVTNALVANTLNALHGECLLSSNTEPPTWISGESGPDPLGLLPFQNGVLDISTARLLPATPNLFTLNACPFNYDPGSPEPGEWLRFLESLWPDDPESIATLQEWFGYLLTADTRQQKILFLLGPKRSGKGTICRVLAALAGKENVAGPTLNSLTTNFGLSPLIGKTVAIISDARLSNRADAVVVTERLLSISGEDTLTVDRKHRDPITLKLPTRFVIASNELPRLGDASGALAGRFILLRLTQSFFGAEDHGLTDRLLKELPGILNWALAGWRRLHDRGRFTQPTSGAELLAELEDLASPVGAFVRDKCRVEPGASVETGELYLAWRTWCEDHGRKEPGTEATFGRDLRAAVPTLAIRRPRRDGGRQREYVGIRLKRWDETTDEPDSGSGSDPNHGSSRWQAWSTWSTWSADLPMHAKLKKNKNHTKSAQKEIESAIERSADHVDHVDHDHLFPAYPRLPD